jgi:peptide chain release factor 2
MSEPDFWLASRRSEQNRELADKKIESLGELRALVDKYGAIEKEIPTLKENRDENKFYETKKKLRELELETLFGGPYDKRAAVLCVYPGVGGEDAEDWARMLAEMYRKYAAKRKWQIAVLDDNPRSRAFEIRGVYAYGYLKYEAGVHRLVRISPFSPNKLRHTSFALVEVIPDLPPLEESKLRIPEKDLKFEFYRSGGPGGQNVNKVETAVRVVHIPTGLTANCQTERSQAQNREYALKLLRAKLFQLMEKNQVSELAELRVKAKPEWGSQIRSYVLNPYKLIKDHRTEAETSRVDEVLGGNLDVFIESGVELLGGKKPTE